MRELINSNFTDLMLENSKNKGRSPDEIEKYRENLKKNNYDRGIKRFLSSFDYSQLSSLLDFCRMDLREAFAVSGVDIAAYAETDIKLADLCRGIKPDRLFKILCIAKEMCPEYPQSEEFLDMTPSDRIRTVFDCRTTYRHITNIEDMPANLMVMLKDTTNNNRLNITDIPEACGYLDVSLHSIIYGRSDSVIFADTVEAERIIDLYHFSGGSARQIILQLLDAEKNKDTADAAEAEYKNDMSVIFSACENESYSYNCSYGRIKRPELQEIKSAPKRFASYKESLAETYKNGVDTYLKGYYETDEGITYASLAKMIGMDSGSLFRVFREYHILNPDNLVQLCYKCLGMSCHEFMLGVKPEVYLSGQMRAVADALVKMDLSTIIRIYSLVAEVSDKSSVIGSVPENIYRRYREAAEDRFSSIQYCCRDWVKGYMLSTLQKVQNSGGKFLGSTRNHLYNCIALNIPLDYLFVNDYTEYMKMPVLVKDDENLNSQITFIIRMLLRLPEEDAGILISLIMEKYCDS